MNLSLNSHRLDDSYIKFIYDLINNISLGCLRHSTQLLLGCGCKSIDKYIFINTEHTVIQKPVVPIIIKNKAYLPVALDGKSYYSETPYNTCYGSCGNYIFKHNCVGETLFTNSFFGADPNPGNQKFGYIEIQPPKQMVHPTINVEEHIKILEHIGYDTSKLYISYGDNFNIESDYNTNKFIASHLYYHCNQEQIQNKLGLIVEYSAANINSNQLWVKQKQHKKDSEKFISKINSQVYVPCLYYIGYINGVLKPRKNSVITAFYLNEKTSFDEHRSRHRRYYLCKRLEQKLGSSYKNFMGIEDLLPIYLDSKILINVHQTNNHLTIEEQRILPALMCGMVVISEDGPFRETIPYQEYIIWCSYEELEDKAQEVLDNYDYYFNKIHGPESKLKDVLYKMEIQMEVDLKNALIEQDLLELDLAAEEVFFEDLYKKTKQCLK